MFKRTCLALLLATLALAPAAPRTQAAPAPQAANLVINGDFETTGGSSGTAQWLPWWSETPRPPDGSYNYTFRPQWNAEQLSRGAASAFVFAGNTSQRIINNWDPWHAGVKQVATAPAGARVRLTAHARVWASHGDWPSPSDRAAAVSVQVGLDPNGGDNQFASTVLWSGSVSPHDAWQAVSVEATVGAGGRVGVFLSTNFRGSSRKWLAGFWDEVSLIVVDAPPASTSAPAPTATPAPATPAPTQAPSGSVYVVQPGDTLGGIARRFSVTLTALMNANNIRNANLIFVGQRLIIPGASTAPTSAGPAATPTAGSPTGTIYVVQRGDTLWRIALNFGTTVQRLKQLNGLQGDLIFVGQRLIVR